VKRNVVTVRLVESRATFFETERDAVEEAKRREPPRRVN